MNALLLVDLQNDFLPGGAFPVPQADAILPLANLLPGAFKLIVATQEWHPANHVSFAANHPGRKPGDVVLLRKLPQILRPVHCVQNTRGAQLAPGLMLGRINKVFRKGADPNIDSYSAFFDNGHLQATGLHEYLKDKGVTAVYVMGVATDYCVRASAIDARSEGFDVTVVEDAVRGVEVNPGDSELALQEMRDAGARIATSDEVLAAARSA